MPRSPKESEKCRSSTNLSSSRLGLAPMTLDAPKPREFTLSSTNLRARSPLETVGRRLSHGDGGSPPLPRIGSSNFGGSSANLRVLANFKSDSVSGGATTPRYSRSPAKRGQSFPVFATLRPPPSHSTSIGTATSHHHQRAISKSPLLSPNADLTSAIGRKLSREWTSGSIDLSCSTEAIGTTTFTAYCQQETTLSVERQPSYEHQDNIVVAPTKKPVRRARSHENKDKSVIDAPTPRLVAQPSVGGRTVSERTKKQLESELKAILTARAHHRDLHPP